MTIGRTHGRLYVECDCCGDTLEEEDFNDFQEFVDALKEREWKFYRKSGGDWEHACPDCLHQSEIDLDKVMPWRP